ncbi:MAG: hypothetical protein D6732_27175, partial [Methanobacteriota archaeon]
QTAITIGFRVPENILDSLDKLRAVVWTWLHLGSIGRRSRRGYGSLLWEPQPGDLLDGFVVFNPQSDLATPSALENYLSQGLARVQSIWGAPDNSPRSTFPDQFQLASIDQIFVGQQLIDANGNVLTSIDDSPGGIMEIIHGLNENANGQREELGHAGRAPWRPSTPRQASPMLWRLFPLAGGGYVPVMTWSPLRTTNIPPGTDVWNYLNGKLGFQNSLAGNSL